MKAQEILSAASDTMAKRAAEYDKPEGERSIPATVQAFNAITGRDLTDAEGWLFMQLLKSVRLFSAKDFHADSAIDGAAYAALVGEARAAEVVPIEWPEIAQDRVMAGDALDEDEDRENPPPPSLLIERQAASPLVDQVESSIRADPAAYGFVQWFGIGRNVYPAGLRADTNVALILRNGTFHRAEAGKVEWRMIGLDTDVAWFRVL